LLPSRGQRLLSKAPRQVAEPTQPPAEWVVEALSPGINLTERKANHSPKRTTKVKKVKNYTFSPFM